MLFIGDKYDNINTKTDFKSYVYALDILLCSFTFTNYAYVIIQYKTHILLLI